MPVFTIETPTGQKLDIEAADEAAAIGGAQQWHAQNSKVDTTTDTVKSIGSGVAQGAVDIAGAIPDLAGAVKGAANKYLFDPLFEAVGGPQKSTKSLSDMVTGTDHQPIDVNRMFGSENLKKQAEKVTGSFYEPKTEYGKYAHSIAAGAPSALIGPGGLIAKAGIAVGSGIGSQFLGDKFVGTALEPYARAIGGIIGGAGSMAAGKGVEVARNMSAASGAGKDIGAILGTDPIKAGAVNRVAGSMAEDKITPASAAAIQAQLGPKETMVMDLGRQMQGRAEAIAQHPGEAQNTILNAVEGRTGEFGSGARTRIEETLDQHLGPSRNVVDLKNEVHDIVQSYATPAYESVMAKHPVLVDATLQDLAKRPAIAEAMTRARGVAANYGEDLGGHPSLKYWDYVKKSLDQRINTMMKSGMDDLSSAQKADLGGLINAKQSLVQHLDSLTGGEYATARRIAATKPELDDAMDFGRSIFNSKLLPEEVAAHISDLSIPQQAMVQVGARREIARALDAVRNDGAKARAFLDTNNNLQKIEHLFGPDAAKAIESRVAAENTFQNATQDIAKNSRTSVRQQLRADTETPQLGRIDTTLTGLALKPVNAGMAFLLRHGMENTRTGIGQILTAKEGQLSPIVERLMGYNAKRAANASTPAGQQAAALIRALVAGRGSESQ